MKLSLLAILSLCFCALPSLAQNKVPNPTYTWGGPGVRVDLNFNPQAPRAGDKQGSVEFDCASGFFEKVTTDGAGNFMADGVYIREGGYSKKAPVKDRVKYFGYVFGDYLNLVIVHVRSPYIEGAATTADVFTVQAGQTPLLHKCK